MMSPDTGYAMALLKASLAQDNVIQVCEDLPVIEKLLSRFASFFRDPQIKATEKADILRELLDGKADALTVQFVILLAQRRRLHYLPRIRRQYAKMSAALLGHATVRLWVPYELSEEMLSRLQVYLADIGLWPSGKKSEVRFDTIIDKSLIGGFIAESEGRMLDLSLKTRLARLHRA